MDTTLINVKEQDRQQSVKLIRFAHVANWYHTVKATGTIIDYTPTGLVYPPASGTMANQRGIYSTSSRYMAYCPMEPQVTRRFIRTSQNRTRC
jgi:hypothetical protein